MLFFRFHYFGQTLSQKRGKLHSRLLEHLVQRRNSFHHAGNKIGCSRVSVPALASVPNGNLVDLDILDSLDLNAHKLLKLVGNKHFYCRIRVSRSFNKSTHTLRLLLKYLLCAAGFGFHFCV